MPLHAYHFHDRIVYAPRRARTAPAWAMAMVLVEMAAFLIAAFALTYIGVTAYLLIGSMLVG